MKRTRSNSEYQMVYSFAIEGRLKDSMNEHHTKTQSNNVCEIFLNIITFVRHQNYNHVIDHSYMKQMRSLLFIATSIMCKCLLAPFSIRY